MIDIINDATDEIIMAESEDSKLMEELHKNKSDLIDDFDRICISNTFLFKIKIKIAFKNNSKKMCMTI
jgi:hypothetical protein